ncbi:sugar-binding transcriptional regulator [Companilactobacillus zhachilii]|jgi:Transcriptional regulator, contains sigma factor-related N-terminal domain|uniref:Sugar-binding transcriptional regulator n=1 Tax=Companilactobacillus zhachilii TaxID=2304606 RepID=A0A386PWG6_9LACO|nr:sugar-binding domain-containing protein [Companilactobacillus zhachilii]AYE38847.1 sugar-binding transcriptional regulator [Companilactobacillus zhachilii]
MPQEENTSLLVDLAQDYYLNHLNLGDISKKYNISRYKISKYLSEAIDKKIVTINISSPFSRSSDLENKLRENFPNPNFYVLKNTEDIAHENDRFYSFAAKYLQDLIDGKKIIGLTWGDTIYHVIDAFQTTAKDNMVFTQFIGENGKHNSLAGTMRMVQKVATRYNGKYLTIDVPLYIVNKEVRRLLALEPAIQPSLATAEQLDLIFTSVGTLDSINSIDSWYNSKNILFPKVNSNSIAGLVYGRPIDKEGNVLVNEDDDKVFGISFKKILEVPSRVAIVNDKFKSSALSAALQGNYFTDVILNEPTANKLLAEL